MRVADALMVTVSRHVIRVENTVTTSNLEALEVDLNGTTSNYFLLSLLVLTYFLHLPSSEHVSMIKRLRRKLLHTCTVDIFFLRNLSKRIITILTSQ